MAMEAFVALDDSEQLLDFGFVGETELEAVFADHNDDVEHFHAFQVAARLPGCFVHRFEIT